MANGLESSAEDSSRTKEGKMVWKDQGQGQTQSREMLAGLGQGLNDPFLKKIGRISQKPENKTKFQFEKKQGNGWFAFGLNGTELNSPWSEERELEHRLDGWCKAKDGG